MSDLIGDRYDVLEVLWTGGDTDVARGIDRRHDRPVCLKITRLRPGEDPAPLLDEGRLLLGLPPHPAMPIVRDDVLLDDRYVLVIDWVEGNSAERMLREQGAPGLPVSTVLAWLPAVASALDHLHAQRPSVVHGDVRPGNVIVDGERAMLVFGAAALRNASATSVGDDVRMLANTVIRLLTGTETEAGAPIVWDGVAPELAKRLDRVLRRALDPDAVRRPGAASELLERLQSARETALPTGVVTFVLTDIQGSTPLWEEHPNTMAGVIARHHELAADIAEAHGGRMPRSQGEGDSTLAAFAHATDAIDATLAFQRAVLHEPWPEGIDLKVRAGLHTGEAEVDHGDYFGTALSRTARLRGLARGGQVLLSRATAELVADRLASGITLRDLGRVHLKGLERAEEVYQLCAPDLPDLAPATALVDAAADRARLLLPITLDSAGVA